METRISIFIFAFSTAICISLAAMDIKDIAGKTYLNVKISDINPDGIAIKHSKGITYLRRDMLPQGMLRYIDELKKRKKTFKESLHYMCKRYN